MFELFKKPFKVKLKNNFKFLNKTVFINKSKVFKFFKIYFSFNSNFVPEPFKVNANYKLLSYTYNNRKIIITSYLNHYKR